MEEGNQKRVKEINERKVEKKDMKIAKNPYKYTYLYGFENKERISSDSNKIAFCSDLSQLLALLDLNDFYSLCPLSQARPCIRLVDTRL